MDRETLFGGNPVAVLLRLAVLSIIVGIVMSALDITPKDLIFRLRLLMQRVYDLGFGAFESVLQYLLLGAVVVVPVWLFSTRAIWPPIADALALRRPRGVDRIVAFVTGFARGLRSRVESETLCFR